MDRSVPITLAGKDYDLWFEQEDVIACEEELHLGYTFFFIVENRLPVYLSLKLCRTLVHHGLKKKDTKGDLSYAFPQSETGAIAAGLLVKEHVQAGGNLMDIWKGGYDAFKIGWYAKPKPGDETKEKTEPEDRSKNSPGTG